MKVRVLTPHQLTSDAKAKGRELRCIRELVFLNGWADRATVIRMTATGNRRSQVREFGEDWLVFHCNDIDCDGKVAVRLRDVADVAEGVVHDYEAAQARRKVKPRKEAGVEVYG